MKTVKTLDQLMPLIESDPRPLFIRWSNGVANDRKMGCSRNHSSGQMEAGVSVNTLHDRDGIFNSRGFVAMQVREYSHLAPVGYVLTGVEVGTGSDNEIVIDAKSWEPIAKIVPALVEEAKLIHAMTGSMCDHPANKRSRYAGGVEFCDKCGAKLA